MSLSVIQLSAFLNSPLDRCRCDFCHSTAIDSSSVFEYDRIAGHLVFCSSRCQSLYHEENEK